MAAKKSTGKRAAGAATKGAKSEAITGKGEFRGSPKAGKSFIAGTTFGLKPVEYAQIDGRAVFEGDIDLGSVAEMELVRKDVETPPPEGVAFSVAITGTQFRWPGGVIPFTIDAALPNQQRVTDAIAHIQANTNLRFRARTTEANFVTYRPAGGCSSSVGMRGGQQFVNLGAGCSLGNAIHETCHTAGLWHEQSREDRNNFVTINFVNIDPAMAFNFNQQIVDGDDIGWYDYGSIMHYPRNAFAINSAIDTITPKPDPNVAIGQRNGLSAGDIAAINALYPRMVTLPETSNTGVALATSGPRVLMAWTGTGNLRLNMMSSANGLVYTNKVTLNDVSPAAVSLAFFNNRFYVAWIGVGNNQLNVMSSSNGISWSNKVTLAETSPSSPTLGVMGGKLFIAWRGTGNNRLNVMSSTNGTSFANKVTLADTTPSGPALVGLGTKLMLAWRGVGNNQLNVMQSTNGTAFSQKVTLGETTVSRPGLHASGGRAILTWQGNGNQFLNALVSTNGSAWGSKLTSSQTCIDGPAVTSIGTSLVWGWDGTDTNHHLNSMLFNIV